MGAEQNVAQEKKDRRRAKSEKKAQVADVVWYNPEANELDKKSLDEEAEHLGDMVVDMCTDLVPGDRLYLKMDEGSGRWAATLVLIDVEGQASKLGVGVRAADPLGALGLLAYMHVHKYKGKYPVVGEATPGRWG